MDGYLDLIIEYPDIYLPEKLKQTFLIEKDLPKLTVTNFAYSRTPISPKVVVMPFIITNKENYFLKKQAKDLKALIEDYLSAKGAFRIASSRMIYDLFRQFNIDYTQENINWKEIPLIKKELDAIIFGKIGGDGKKMTVQLNGCDYTGEKIFEIDRTIYLREMQILSEYVVNQFKYNFPLEGNITSITEKIYVNLGKRHGISNNNLFYGFTDYFDEIKMDYSKKRVVTLKISEPSETFSVGELEDVSEGYLLEPGVKVKRYVRHIGQLKDVPLAIVVISKKKALSDANVYLDDHWFGQTNDEGKLNITVKPNISIEFLVYKEGYIPTKSSVKITEDIKELNFDLKQGKTLFRVSSEPEGAVVFIDGEFKGTTPLREKPIVVPYGFHLVELEIEGYTKFKKYINFNERKISLVGNDKVIMFPDYLKRAEVEYTSGNIQYSLRILENVSETQPDYYEAMELLGYIYLNDIEDFKKSIEFYNRSLENSQKGNKTAKNMFSYYNLAQAYFNVAEGEFYVNKSQALYNYQQAITNLNIIKGMKARIPPQKKVTLYQDILFYTSVSYQKLYYLTLKNEYLNRASFSWNDYFDYFKADLLNNAYFRKQYDVAKSYKEEAERLKGEK